MSQQLEFKVIARDQASAVVTSVQKKVMDFGKDIGRSIGAALGPIALVTMAIQKISEVMAENAAKRKEAFDWGADLAASAAALGVTVEQFQAIQRASEETGQSVDKIGRAYKLASDLIASAKAGNLEAAAALGALGINLNDIEKTKPEEVLGRLGRALSTIDDPAKKGEAAIAALGKEAKNLQDVLEKGFDIEGAFNKDTTLTEAEAAELANLKKEIKRQKEREMLELARKQAADALTTRLMQEEADIAQGKKPASEQSKELTEFKRRAQAILAQTGQSTLTTEQGRAIVSGMLREGIVSPPTGRPPAPAPTDADRAAGERLGKIADDQKKKEEKPEDAAKKGPDIKIKKREVEDVAKTAAVTVSSLRAIGGGIAGEQVGLFDVQQMQLDVQKQIRDVLHDINGNLKPPTDFSKPVIDGMPDLSGRTGNIGVA